jgi:hypothetical protein
MSQLTILSAGDWFLIVVGFLYIGAAACYFFEGKTAMFLVMSAYAVANYGLVLAANKI